MLPQAAAQIVKKEINEREGPDWIGGRAIRNLLRSRIISLSSVVRATIRNRSGTEIQNLSESIRLVILVTCGLIY